MFSSGDTGSFMQGFSSLIDSGVNLGTGIYNLFNSERNNRNQTAAKNWAFADSRAASSALKYYITHGNLDNFNASLDQDYDDVADYLNPFLSLSSLDLSKQAQKLSEDQFKYSKYVTENSAKIRMDDYKNAGLSPLLVAGNSASYSPVSISGGGIIPSGKNRPTPQNIASLNFQSNLAGLISNLRLSDANVANINADTALKKADANLRNSQVETEKTKPALNQANVDYLVGQLKNLPALQELTYNQAEYYISKVMESRYNRSVAAERGYFTHDTTPDDIKSFSYYVSSMGIDPYSEKGRQLVSIGVATGAVIDMIGKGLLKKGVK